MGESRPAPDTASASSDDSIRPPPRIDPSRIKPGPGFLPVDAFDPLKHNEWDTFWRTVDGHFQPINQDHLRFLRSLPVNPYNATRDRDLRLPQSSISETSSTPDHSMERRKELKREAKREKLDDTKQRPVDRSNPVPHKLKLENSLGPLKPASSSPNTDSAISLSSDPDRSGIHASLNSFPFTHRLVAALLDENPAVTPVPAVPLNRANRPLLDEPLWMGVGTESEVRKYQLALESRVKHELLESGLLDERQDDPVQSAVRHEQWKLRDLKTLNRTRKGSLYTNIIGTELRAQALRREVKRYEDKVEMAYLERTIRNMKKNKKSRAKFQKLLQRMYGHYKEKDKNTDKNRKTGEIATNGRLQTNGDEKVRPTIKKKKKKADLPGASASASVQTNGNRNGTT